MRHHSQLTVNGCTYPPDEVKLAGSPATSINITNTMPAEGCGHSFMRLNETMKIKCRNEMRMSPNLADSTRTITCSTGNVWIVDNDFECVSSRSQATSFVYTPQSSSNPLI